MATEPFDIDVEADRIVSQSDTSTDPVAVTIGGRIITFPPMVDWPYAIHERLAEGDMIEAFEMVLEDDPEAAEFIRKQPAKRVLALGAYLNKVSGVNPEDFARSARRSRNFRRK